MPVRAPLGKEGIETLPPVAGTVTKAKSGAEQTARVRAILAGTTARSIATWLVSVKSFDVVLAPSAHSRRDVKLTLEIEAEAPVGARVPENLA
jgi:hypothetical protein